MYRASLVALILASSLGLWSVGQAFEIQDCTGGKHPDAKLDAVSVSSCPDASGDYCVFQRGANVSIEVDFTTVSSFSSAKVSVAGKIGFVWIPFNVSPSEACANYGFDCPVPVGQQVKFKLSLPILRTYPKIKTQCKLQLTDESDNPIVCLQFPARLQ